MGNQVGSDNVVGRDELISRIWRRLETDSLLFTAERRIGKTTVMKKLEAEPQAGKRVVFVDLEKVDSPIGFTESLIAALHPLFSKKQSAMTWLTSAIKDLGGIEIGGILKIPEQNRTHWRGLLEKSIDAICTNHADEQIILLFDELPYMLQKINEIERGSDSTNHAALTVLDTLRDLRQKHPNLRMIFAGSVGLHHVLTELRNNRLASQPVNDMVSIEIGPLETDDAAFLAKRLLIEEKVTVSEDLELVVSKLIELTDRVPFYLHRSITRLADHGAPVTVTIVQTSVLNQLTNDLDHWQMEHFRSRLKTYYPGTIDDSQSRPIQRSQLAANILDILSIEEEALTIDGVCTALAATTALSQPEPVIELLRLLSLDHYLICDSQKRYSFRFPLIRKWWVIAQGLS